MRVSTLFRILAGVACVGLSLFWFRYADQISKSEMPAIAATPLIAGSYVCGCLFILIGVVSDIGYRLRASAAESAEVLESIAKQLGSIAQNGTALNDKLGVPKPKPIEMPTENMGDFDGQTTIAPPATLNRMQRAKKVFDATADDRGVDLESRGLPESEKASRPTWLNRRPSVKEDEDGVKNKKSGTTHGGFNDDDILDALSDDTEK